MHGRQNVSPSRIRVRGGQESKQELAGLTELKQMAVAYEATGQYRA